MAMLFRSRPGFFGLSALLFAAATALTIAWSGAMPGMTMPQGGAGMRMPGHTWPGAALSFLVMWMVMMAAMMLPSLAPALWRYREAMGPGDERGAAQVTALAGAGYFFVWFLFGVAAFPLSLAFAAVEVRLPGLTQAVPVLVADVVLIAGLLQFSRWKAHHLACCREDQAGSLPVDANTAFRHGVRLGVHCSISSLGPTAILLAAGMMDFRVMAAMTAAITAERLAPDGVRAARLTGVVMVAAGLFLIGRAGLA